jgi:membrane associated rhomboid family serine protease
MLDDFVNQLISFADLMKNNIPATLVIVGIFWFMFFATVLTGYRLNRLGVYPRHLLGVPGIFFHSFLHGDFNHLFFNSIPLFVLVDFILIEGLPVFLHISLTIILLSGAAVWCFGRRAIHIGASSLIMGYWGYLLLNAYQHPSVSTVILAIVCLYYFGGFLFDLFPREEKVSWEGHLFGFLAGIVSVYLWNT